MMGKNMMKSSESIPYAPIPSASGFGVGFGYLNTFSQGIWSTRAKKILTAPRPANICFKEILEHIFVYWGTNRACSRGPWFFS